MRRLIPCLGVVLLLGACSPDKGFGPAEEVEADDYGSDWPLTVDSALVNCGPGGGLLIQIDGRSFGLAGITDENVPPAFERVWASDPSRGDAHMDLSPLVEDARALCE